MKIEDRILCYREIEKVRGRPLIVYATSTRNGVGGGVAPDTVREFIDQMDKIDSRDGIDVLLHSAGGDPLTAWKLMSVLREQFKSVAVLVPSAAFSAATLFALGADEIHMHPHASLGPIDPQMTVRTADGKVRHFAYEDVGAFLKFLSSDVGLSDQPYFAALAEKLLSTVDPLIVGAARRASDLSGEVGARLLMMHMADGTQANEIARNLNKSFFAHGDAVSRSRAKELRLQVADTPKDLEVLMWRAYLGLEAYMMLREPFQPHIELLRDATAAAQMRAPAPLALPPNLPPEAAQQLLNQLFTVVLQKALAGAVEVPYEVLNAVVESPRVASEFRSRGTLTGFRKADGQLQVTATDHEAGWRTVAVPVGPLAT